MIDERQTDEQTATPQGILADVVSREALRAMADEEEKTAAHLERRAAAMLQQAEQLARLAEVARIRAAVLREVGG